jgi:small subunit ribosomal protein S11
MLGLKEFYQYKRELKKHNKAFQSKFLIKKNYSFPNSIVAIKPLSVDCQAILYLRSSFNNTIICLSTLKGKVISLKSCGCLGFFGKKKRSTKFAIESTLDAIVNKAKNLKINSLILHLNGFAKGRFYILRYLKRYNIKVLGIRDITPNPHNGCRLRKLRRG